MINEIKVVDDSIDQESVCAQDYRIKTKFFGPPDKERDVLVEKWLPSCEVQSRIVGTNLFKKRDGSRGIQLRFFSGRIAIAAPEIASFCHIIISDQGSEAAYAEPEIQKICKIIQEEFSIRFFLSAHSY